MRDVESPERYFVSKTLQLTAEHRRDVEKTGQYVAVEVAGVVRVEDVQKRHEASLDLRAESGHRD